MQYLGEYQKYKIGETLQNTDWMYDYKLYLTETEMISSNGQYKQGDLVVRTDTANTVGVMPGVWLFLGKVKTDYTGSFIYSGGYVALLQVYDLHLRQPKSARIQCTTYWSIKHFDTYIEKLKEKHIKAVQKTERDCANVLSVLAQYE